MCVLYPLYKASLRELIPCIEIIALHYERWQVNPYCAFKGCCLSKPPSESEALPCNPSDVLGDSSATAIATSPSRLPETTSPRISVTPATSQRNRNRADISQGEQFTAPLRPHVWTSKREWTRSQLDRERREFFDTRVSGHAEIWATLKTVVDLLAESDIPTAQSILDAAAVTVPTGNLKNGAYDENGNFYHLPEHVISDPQNVVLDDLRKEERVEVLDAVDDKEEIERRRKAKGKGPLGDEGDSIRVKARLSDRGGLDMVVHVGRDETVKRVVRRIQEEANITGNGKIKIAYMGKILKENESLQAQGWLEGHVVNALVFQ
ncbi:MAG: hypothetical protein Q9217_000773 [Psora testacea]